MRIDAIRQGTVYIIGDEKLKCNARCLTHEDNEGILFVTNTNIEGIFRYGYEQTKEDRVWGHAPGYIWASRASCMNAVFDVALIECCYKEEGSPSYTTCAIDLAHLEPLLEGTEYEIDWTPHPSSDGTDVHYKLKKKDVI